MKKITQEDILDVNSVAALDYFYNKFEKRCAQFKETKGDDFIYIIEPDYENLKLKVFFELNVPEENDYTERDPQLN